MLEILALWAFAKKIGRIVEQKGYKSGGFKFLTVVLWFGGELLGAVIGVALRDPYDTSLGPVYVVALLGLGAGALTAYLIAAGLPTHESPVEKPVQATPQGSATV